VDEGLSSGRDGVRHASRQRRMASRRGEEGGAMEVNVLLVTETGRGAPMRLAKPASTIPAA
jgi:hypothetical protein